MPAALIPELQMIEALRTIGGSKLLGKLFRSFLGNAPVRLAAMRAALTAADAPAAGLVAHKVKSSAGQLGMTALQALAQQFELAAELPGADVMALTGLLGRMEDTFGDYRPWVENALAELAG
jgi:HPt (histidine-containing phosphotransfer) domain-containing protein